MSFGKSTPSAVMNVFDTGIHLEMWTIYTRNKGASYTISDFEQYDVYEIVQSTLSEHCYFDFEIIPGKRAGIPYYLPFTKKPPRSSLK